MKKPFFLLFALFMFTSQNCFAQVTTHKSHFGNYLKIQSETMHEMENPTAAVTVTMSKDATFTKNKKTGELIVIESNSFSISLQQEKDFSDKKEAGKENLLFGKKDLPFFFIDQKTVPFKEVFAIESVGDKHIRAVFTKKTKKILGEARQVTLVLVKGEAKYSLDISPEDLSEWQQILAFDIKEEYNNSKEDKTAP